MKSSKAHTGLLLLKGGVSMLALSAFAATLAAPAFAQDAAPAAAAAPADDAQQVVVVGVRRSLKTAQQIKRDADTIVDSITATDIGAFPDKSVAEALQRVAGITVSRFAATGDTAHFSSEPSGVLVRGLSQVRSEFNGRDTFSANSSRGLSWGDVSPELMSGVDTYKNQTAELIEGGISGSINLKTRTPFDSKGHLYALSADYVYNDLSKNWTPAVSGIYSNRWDTSIGEFGLMINGAYSNVKTRSEGVQYGRIGIFDKSVFGTPGKVYIPTNLTYHDNLYNRTRQGVAAAGQWQNHDHTMLATLQYNDSSYDNTWEEHYLSAGAFGMWQVNPDNVYTNKQIVEPWVDPATNTAKPFTFDSAGFFQTGTMTSKLLDSSAGGPFGKNEAGQPFFSGCYDWAGKTDAQCRQAASVGTGTRYATTKEKTQDTSFNFKWDVNDHIKTMFDVQYVHSTVDNYDMTADTATYATTYFDYSGKYPKVKFTMPTAAENFAASPGFTANQNNYHTNDLMDHAETSEGHEIATRADVQYSFGGEGWLDSLKVGVRYADREQEINWSTYNWQSITQPWNSSPSIDECYSVNASCYPKVYETLPFGGDLLGGGLINQQQFVFTKMSAIKDRTAFGNEMNQKTLSDAYNDAHNPAIVAYNTQAAAYNAAHQNDPDFVAMPIKPLLSGITFPGWTPLCMRSGDIAGSCYLHQENNQVSEKTSSGYAMLKFGGNDKTLFGFGVSGNVGLRYVQTVDASTGFITYPTTQWLQSLTCVVGGPNPQPTDRQLGCLIGTPGAVNLNAAVAYSGAAGKEITTEQTHINWLPSFNVKFNLTDKWVLRFAASRAMSRPDMGYLKNYIAVGSPQIDLTCTTSPERCIKDSSGKNIDYKPLFTASAGNPHLKSTTADQFDLSLENYFASVGSFSFDLFYKKFNDYIQFGNYTTNFTTNGVTETVKVNGPINADGATIKGFEVAYQRFFDFLPAPFDGLGIQANYTHLHNTGITNTNLTNVSGDGGTNTGAGGIPQAQTAINPHALEGLSDNAYNLIGMYEKGPWALRAAYNWREKYLVTAADCCVGLPVWQGSQGFLDASVRYKINDNIEVSLEGNNLTGTDTVLFEQVEGDIPGSTPNAPRKLMPNGAFKNDRRVQVGIRLKY